MFTQKMADENKTARDQAAKLLSDHWNAVDERELETDAARDYVKKAVALVSQKIQEECLPEVPIKRIRAQVANLMARERGKLWREERGL